MGNSNVVERKNQIKAILSELVSEDGRIYTTSLQVAGHFCKRHDTVLRAIANLECSVEFTDRNFAVSEYTDATGRKLPSYRITRDGFVFLAMGFTGREAAAWKEAYIQAFNQKEAENARLKQRADTPPVADDGVVSLDTHHVGHWRTGTQAAILCPDADAHARFAWLYGQIGEISDLLWGYICIPNNQSGDKAADMAHALCHMMEARITVINRMLEQACRQTSEKKGVQA